MKRFDRAMARLRADDLERDRLRWRLTQVLEPDAPLTLDELGSMDGLT